MFNQVAVFESAKVRAGQEDGGTPDELDAAFEGTWIIGARWNPETHQLKDFLAKSQIPYRWIEPGAALDPLLRASRDQAWRD